MNPKQTSAEQITGALERANIELQTSMLMLGALRR